MWSIIPVPCLNEALENDIKCNTVITQLTLCRGRGLGRAMDAVKSKRFTMVGWVEAWRERGL